MLERLKDIAFLTPAQRALQERTKLRQEEVKREKKQRYKRAKAYPNVYKHKTTEKALEDLREIQGEYWSVDPKLLPPPDIATKFGDYCEFIWLWHGENAIETAKAFLLLAKRCIPDAMGYLSVGNGNGKNSNWIGTRRGNPQDIWKHSQTMFSSKSGNTTVLAKLPQTEGAGRLWAEVKLTTKGRVTFEDKRKAGKIVRNKPKTTKSKHAIRCANGRPKLPSKKSLVLPKRNRPKSKGKRGRKK